MDTEGFFARWSRRKAQAAQARAPQTVEPQAEATGADDVLPSPTLEDVDALTPDSDFSRFVARGVEPGVRRSAMKKLFADPHFHAMDGLDIYIEDYNRFQPMSAAMLAALNHAQGVLNPQPLFDSAPEGPESAAQAANDAARQDPPIAEQADAKSGGKASGAPDKPEDETVARNGSGDDDTIQDL